MRVDQVLQRGGLARGPRRRRQGRVDQLDRRAGADDEIEVPFDLVAVAKRAHLLHLFLDVDSGDREGYVAEERPLGEPHQDIRVLAERPQHAEPFDEVERLAQDVDAFVFNGVKMVHGLVSGSRKARNVYFPLGSRKRSRASRPKPARAASSATEAALKT